MNNCVNRYNDRISWFEEILAQSQQDKTKKIEIK